MKVGDILLGLKVDVSALKAQTEQAGQEAGSSLSASLTEKLNGGFTVLKGTIAGITTGAVTKLTDALTGGIKAGISYKATLEQTTAAFETMTGSAAKAQGIVDKLSNMAASTPFEMTDLTGATKILMEYGLTADKAVESMSMLGDIAQGDAQKMTSLALAYGQMSSLGKVQLQDVKQMIGAGFNPLMVISKKTGESMESLYDRISKGTLSINEITAAMQTATSKGGAYYGSMAKQSRTLNGAIATLKENATKLMSTLLSPAITWFANVALPYLTKAIDKVQSKLNKLLGIKTTSGSEQSMAKLTGLSDGLGKSAAKTRDVITGGAKKAADAVKKAANEAKRGLAAFDQINNLITSSKTKTGRTNKKKSTSGSASGSEGGDGDSDDGGPAGSVGKQSGGALQKAAEKLKNVFGPSINRLKSNTKRLIDDIADSVKKVALNGTGLKTLHLMAGIINGIFGTIANIAGALAKAWEHNNTGTKIVQHLWNILNSILDTILKILNFVKEIISRLDFSPVLEAINSVLGLADQIFQIVDKTTKIVLNKLLKGDYIGAGKAFSDGLKEAIETVQKWIDNLDFSGIAKAINKALKNGLEWMKGLDISGIFGDIGKLVASVFNQIVDFLSKVDWNDVFQVLEKSFENLLNALFSFLGNFLSHVDWEKVFGVIWDILGNMMKTHSGRLILAFAGFKVGKGALSSLLKLNKSLSSVAKLMTKIGTTGSLFEALFGAGGTFANISTVLHGIGTALSTVGSALSGVFSSVIGFVSANPVTLIIAGIVAAIAVLVALYRHCKTFRNFVNTAFGFIIGAVKKVAKFVKEHWQAILVGIAAVIQFFSPLKSGITSIFLTVAKFAAANPVFAIIAAIVAVIAAVVLLYKHCKTFRNIVNGIWKFITGIFKKVVGFVKKDWKEILLFAANPIAGLFAIFYKHSEKFRKVVNGMLKAVKNFFTGIIDKAVGFFSAIGKAISGFFKAVVDGAKRIAAAIKNSVVGQVVGAAVNGVAGLIGGAIDMLPHFATGGYVEANTPRLAVVGDNRGQGEFIAPEGKLKAAVQQAMAEERVYNAGNSATSTGALLAVLYEILKELKDKDLTIDGDKLTAMIERKKKEKGLRTG